ncbi:MAG: phosphopantothenoylcysteine decarboxylase [Planctomycetota bacterium]
MRILITAGGTRAYIDEVRWIGNVSSGRFGADIAKACLKRGAEVVHLHAEGAQLPFHHTIDLMADLEPQFAECRELAQFASEWHARYRTVPFKKVSEYADELERLLRTEPFDVVFLAAAVSDYAPRELPGKIRSDSDEIVVRLARVPKLIARVKSWAPNIYQVGFKLLAGAAEEELLEAARNAALENHSDLTVANDLRPLRQGNHTIHLVRLGHPTETYSASENPAERLVERVLEWQGSSRGE